ncbi:MAG TPA: twin-arginine translocation signal domain-containing protein [Candidatus Nanoarchaeia archaeon]|nr:twin-arginine translocation signal domain-containing protein [Candidatus Nanoarchaeia archaeon]
MELTRRKFLKSAAAGGAGLLVSSSVAHSQPYSEIFGIADLIYHILRLEEEGTIHPQLFSGKIGNKSVTMKTNGAVTLVDFITLETKISFAEDGSELELNCHDLSIKGYIDGRQPDDYIGIEIKKNDEIESGFGSQDNKYSFHHYRKLRYGEKKPEGSTSHHKHDNFIQDGYCFYLGNGNNPFFEGIYKPSEGSFWKAHEYLLGKSRERFRYAHKIYRETLPQVILELGKQGKLVLPR